MFLYLTQQIIIKYVALSRIKTLNGLYLQNFNPAKVMTDEKVVEDDSNSTIAHLINRRLKKEGFITKRINYDKGYSIVVAPPGFSTDNIPEKIQVSSYKNRK